MATWESQTKALQSGDDSAEPLVQRQLCQQRSILAAVLSNIPPREISDACKSYRITGVQVAQGFFQNTNIIIKSPWPWQFVSQALD